MAQALLQFDAGFELIETTPQLLHGVEPHVGTGVAAAAIAAGHIVEAFLRSAPPHLVQDAGLGEHDEARGGAAGHPVQQLAGGADEIGQIEQMLLTFRMGDHLGLGMLQAQLQ